MEDICFACPLFLSALLQTPQQNDEIKQFFKDTIISMSYFDDKGDMWVIMKDGLGGTELWKIDKTFGKIKMDLD